MVSINIAAITARLIPRPVMLRMIGAAECTIVRKVRPVVHSCHDASWDLDGPSPAETCMACRNALDAWSRANKAQPVSVVQTQSPIEDRLLIEGTFIAERKVNSLMEYDLARNINRPWWFYMELADNEDDVETERIAWMQEFKTFKALQAEHGFWYEEPATIAKRDAILASVKRPTNCKDVVAYENMREYIRSVVKGSGKVREDEFKAWLATPKNKRPLFTEGAMLAPKTNNNDIGSLVIKKVPATVLLSDIRIVMSRFGAVRDVYRPMDRITGQPKPFVFVEMRHYYEALEATEYFGKHPLVLDDNTLFVENASERKTTEQMAAKVGPAKVPIVEKAAPVKTEKKIKNSFAMLADSDSE